MSQTGQVTITTTTQFQGPLLTGASPEDLILQTLLYLKERLKTVNSEIVRYEVLLEEEKETVLTFHDKDFLDTLHQERTLEGAEVFNLDDLI